MAGSKRTRLSPEQRRAQLIELGMELLSRKPIEEVSVEDIAEEAGVSKGLLFHYFGSKLEFQAALVRNAGEQLVAAVQPDLSLTPVETLRASLDRYIDFVERAPHLYISMLRGGLSDVPGMAGAVDASRSKIVRLILGIMPSLGIEHSPLLDFAVRGWIALVEETVIRWLHEQSVEREEILELLTGALPGVVLAPMLGSSEVLEQFFPGFTGSLESELPDAG
ncbi:TetR/AcrR family transcriptional regulator [Hoyosella sp. YIM 151337]|uniref:TetR/AcrR family transcriptional regulator n=1 Tax=Hoyosella sp. YIM 151337 TaxID=2992742 RepID=UPI002235C852|nr:TetR/AcrR family transcriptional regulator [Hoyosella sp. YIM 151337]MCW4355136.1 TetR/AcrR family transcriptional regulator [Hoyosella sp. YIM 151337]